MPQLWLIPLVLHSAPGQHRVRWLRKPGSVCTRFRATFPPHKVKTKREGKRWGRFGWPSSFHGAPRIASLFPPKLSRSLPPSLPPLRCKRQHFLPAGPAALRFAPPRPGTAAACASATLPPPWLLSASPSCLEDGAGRPGWCAWERGGGRWAPRRAVRRIGREKRQGGTRRKGARSRGIGR